MPELEDGSVLGTAKFILVKVQVLLSVIDIYIYINKYFYFILN